MDRTFRTAALRATSSPRKTARMIRKARATTTPMISGRPAGDDVAEVDLGRGRAGDVSLGVGAGDRGGQGGVDQAVGEVGGGGALRGLLGVDGGEQDVPVRGGSQLGDRGGAGHAVEGLLRLGGQGRALGRRYGGLVDDDGEGAVGTGAEGVGHPVVGAPVGEGGGVGAVADVTELEGEDRDGEDDDDCHARGQVPPRPPLDPLGIAVPRPLRRLALGGVGLGDRTAHPEAVDPGADQSQQGRDQGQGAQDGGDDRDGGGEP